MCLTESNAEIAFMTIASTSLLGAIFRRATSPHQFSSGTEADGPGPIIIFESIYHRVPIKHSSQESGQLKIKHGDS